MMVCEKLCIAPDRYRKGKIALRDYETGGGTNVVVGGRKLIAVQDLSNCKCS